MTTTPSSRCVEGYVAELGPGPVLSRRAAWPLVLLLLLLGLGLRWTFAVGPAATDDGRYMKAAASVAQGAHFEQLDHGLVRAIFIVWLAAWIKLGAGAWGLVASDILLGLGIMVTIYWLASKWTSRQAALWALFVLACFPLELLTAGLVVPDHLGLLLALLALGLAPEALAAAPGHRRGRLLLAAACIGLAVSAKELYVVLPILFGLWAVWQVRPRRRALARAVALGALAVAVFSLEHLFFWWWTGDWAYRYHATEAKYGSYPDIAGLTPTDLLYYVGQIFANPGIMGAWGWIMLAAMLCAGTRLRDRRMVLLWTVVFFVFMQYGSTSFQRYQPLPKQWRYMHPIVILGFIPLGQCLWEMWRAKRIGRSVTALLVAGIIVGGLLAANERAAQRRYGEDALRCLALAQQRRDSNHHHRVVLPSWVARGRPLDIAEHTQDWDVVDLSDGLQPAEATRLAGSGQALLAPEIMWRLTRDEPAYVQLRERLRQHAHAEPIEDWRSPLDRLLGLFPQSLPFARKSVIGYYYRITPGALAPWT